MGSDENINRWRTGRTLFAVIDSEGGVSAAYQPPCDTGASHMLCISRQTAPLPDNSISHCDGINLYFRSYACFLECCQHERRSLRLVKFRTLTIFSLTACEIEAVTCNLLNSGVVPGDIQLPSLTISIGGRAFHHSVDEHIFLGEGLYPVIYKNNIVDFQNIFLKASIVSP